jgi:hypothetical protein
MRVTFNAHFAALNLDNLPNFVLSFGNKCESHDVCLSSKENSGDRFVEICKGFARFGVMCLARFDGLALSFKFADLDQLKIVAFV